MPTRVMPSFSEPIVAEPPTQQYGSHRRYVPLYHFILAAMLLLYLVWTIRHVAKEATPQTGWT